MHSLFSKVSVVLVLNSYFAMLFNNTIQTILLGYRLHGLVKNLPSSQDAHCELRTHFMLTGYSAFHYSFLVQASYRLIRVVFYRHRFFHSRRFFLFAVALQWILANLLPLSMFLPSIYVYIPEFYRCWIPLENVRGVLTCLIVIYTLPISIILIIYLLIGRYIRQHNAIQHRRLHSNARDIIVLKRIVIILSVTVAIGVPTMIMLLLKILIDMPLEMAYEIQDFCLAVGFLIAVLCFTWTTPEIRRILKENQNRIVPEEIQRQNPTINPQIELVRPNR